MKVVNGQLVYFYDSPALQLKDGTIGEVVLPEYAALNLDALHRWQSEQKIKKFDACASLYLGMKSQRIPQSLRSELIEPPVLSEARDMKLVEIRLTEPLFLILRGTKQYNGPICQDTDELFFKLGSSPSSGLF